LGTTVPKSNPSTDLLGGGEAVFVARDRGALAEALETGYRAHASSLSRNDERVFGLANKAGGDLVTLHYCRYDTPVRIAFNDMPGFRQFFCLGGGGRVSAWNREFEVTPQLTAILPPGSRFEAEYGAGYAHLVVQIDEDALARTHHAWDDDLKPARLHLCQAMDANKLRRLRRLALGLADQFDDPRRRNDIAIVELQQALVSSFLFDNLHRGELVEVPRAGSDLAGRLRDYLEAHWREPLTVEALAAACGVSVRSVFLQFSDRFDTTPMAYLRDLRLDKARELLSDVEGQLSVIDAALRCGFASFGHFARRYRERFGELPSDTLARRRRPRI
jgi:AraC-like DNA-binding protein